MSNNIDEGSISVSELTFTPDNWSVPQTVTVTGVEDSVQDGDVSYTIVTGAATGAPEYAGIDPADVSVSNGDNDGPAAATMHVSDLDGTVVDLDRFWKAVVTITVVDEAGNPVTGATVNGTWSGNTSGSESVTTDSNGQAEVDSEKVLDKKDSVAFTVDSIVYSMFDYDANANSDPDGGSNGTSIVVFENGTNLPPQALLAEGGFSLASSDDVLTQQLAEAATSQALSLWSQQPSVALPSEFHVTVADLPTGTLGWAYGNTITLDVNANNAGWSTSSTVPTVGQFDLLTVVSHEIGHLLGYGHSDVAGDLMHETLTPGTRRLPGSVPVTMTAMPRSAIVSTLLPEPRLDVSL